MSQYPVSKCCPNCGSTSYQVKDPEGLIGFAYDRVCNKCHTRYTPPTPWWAGYAFIAAGSAFPIITTIGRLGMEDVFPLFVVYVSYAVALGVFVYGVRLIVKQRRDRASQ